MKGSILVVDDEQNILTSVNKALEGEGYRTALCQDAKEALSAAEKDLFDVALLDVRLPGMNGLELLKRLKKKYPRMCCIMMSAHGTIGTAVEATHLGAFDFLEKPVSVEKLLLTIENGYSYGALLEENVELKKQLTDRYEVVGKSKEMSRLVKKISKVAPSPGRVLIQGESGTGKELVAWAIHHASKRSDKPFIRLNCAAIPADLIESELFGYEKGAFTGAASSKAGKFEQANGGTILLDEIGDMAYETQAKVLRVLQEGQFERLGGKKTIEVDVRILAATNKDIPSMIEEGTFREDLYFRLNVIEITVPPLRNRKEDIPDLITHFLSLYSSQNGLSPLKMEKKAVLQFVNHAWPGNVRELRNMVERCAIMAEADIITLEDVKQNTAFSSHSETAVGDFPAGTWHEQTEHFERMIIINALERNDYNISSTARDLGLGRSHLHKKIKALKIKT